MIAVTDRIDAGYYGSIELYDAWDDLGLPANSSGDIWPAILAVVVRSNHEVPVYHGASSFWVHKTPGAAG